MYHPKLFSFYEGIPCLRRMVSQPFTDTTIFPLMVNMECPACGSRHHFRFTAKRLASTPRELDRIQLYCRSNNILQFTLPEDL